jgi:hypothetical protein
MLEKLLRRPVLPEELHEELGRLLARGADEEKGFPQEAVRAFLQRIGEDAVAADTGSALARAAFEAERTRMQERRAQATLARAAQERARREERAQEAVELHRGRLVAALEDWARRPQEGEARRFVRGVDPLAAFPGPGPREAFWLAERLERHCPEFSPDEIARALDLVGEEALAAQRGVPVAQLRAEKAAAWTAWRAAGGT